MIHAVASCHRRWHEICERKDKPDRSHAMFAAWMQKLENLFVAIAFAEAGEFATAYEFAHGPTRAERVRPQV